MASKTLPPMPENLESLLENVQTNYLKQTQQSVLNKFGKRRRTAHTSDDVLIGVEESKHEAETKKNAFVERFRSKKSSKSSAKKQKRVKTQKKHHASGQTAPDIGSSSVPGTSSTTTSASMPETFDEPIESTDIMVKTLKPVLDHPTTPVLTPEEQASQQKQAHQAFCEKVEAQEQASELVHRLKMAESDDFNLKFQPQNMTEIVGNTKAKEKTEKWFTENENNWPVLYIGGPVGIGKSSLVRVFAKTVTRCHLIQLTSYSFPSIQNALRKRYSTPSILLLEDTDAMVPEDRNALTQFLKKHPRLPTPFIVTCSDPGNRHQQKLKSLCQTIFLYPPYDEGPQHVIARIRDLQIKMNLALPKQTVRTIVEASYQDLRQVTTLVQLAYSKISATKRGRLQADGVHETDVYLHTPFQALQQLCLPKITPKVFERAMDEAQLPVFLHENMPSFCHQLTTIHRTGAPTATNITQISDTLEHLSFIDLADSHPSHTCQPFTALATVLSARTNLQCRAQPKQRVAFPTLFGKMANRRSYMQKLSTLTSNLTSVHSKTVLATETMDAISKIYRKKSGFMCKRYVTVPTNDVSKHKEETWDVSSEEKKKWTKELDDVVKTYSTFGKQNKNAQK